MRCQSIDLQDEAGRAATSKTALLAADLCYDDPELARGITLRRETTREVTVHRQDGSARLPGPVTSDESTSGHFISDWELSSTEWRASDSSQLFGPVSRSAEVLLGEGEDLDLDVSQVHAVLSVTPKKAYYRMTVLDSELTSDSMSRPPRTSVSAPEGFTRLEEDEEDEEEDEEGATSRGDLAELETEDVETLVSPDPSPTSLLTSTPCPVGAIPGQKRRYSRSFCPPASSAGYAVAPYDLSPVLASASTQLGSFEELHGRSEGQQMLRRSHEKSTSDSSLMEQGTRSGSWRELIGQLEQDVRIGGSGDLRRPRAPEDDTGSLADESASSGTGESSGGPRSGPFRVSGGRVRRIRHRQPVCGNEERRRSTSMQLAEQAEKIFVEAAARTRNLHDDTDSQVSGEFDSPDDIGPMAEDSLDQAWDNYQSPMYPSCLEDDDEEEKLDLLWDEQLEASVHDRLQRRLDHANGDWEEDDALIEELLSRSSQILERARNSLGTAVPPPDVLTSEVVTLSSPHGDDNNSDAAELERELCRQKDWLRACDSNLNCLDHLKESLTDSGVEDDLDPIRQQVEHLFKEWMAFKEETLTRLRLIESLRHVHEEADIVKREAQRLADLMDAPVEQRFMDRAQLDKFVSVLEFYFSQVPEWRQRVKIMHQDVLGSLENDQVDYFDVRKCYAENLHLLNQWLFSLYSRTDVLLKKTVELCDRHNALLALMCNCDAAIEREQHLLRCTRLAADLIEPGELETSCHDLQALSRRLLAISDDVDECLRQSTALRQHFMPDHWQHVDSRLTCTANQLAHLQEACAALLSDMSVKLQTHAEPPDSPGGVVPEAAANLKSQPAVGPTAGGGGARFAKAPELQHAVPGWRRRRLWRVLRASLPYQLALLVLFGCFYFLVVDPYHPLVSGLMLSPQLRYAFGSPQ